MRYTVLEVACASEEKVLRLLREGDGREVTAHLRDGWVDTHACPGDVVHLLAALEEAVGESHAVCDCSTGDWQNRSLRGMHLVHRMHLQSQGHVTHLRHRLCNSPASFVS